MLCGMGEDFTRRVAAEVRAEMARQLMSQDKLGQLSGIPQSTLSRRLSGDPRWPFDTNELAAVAEALGVPVEQFMRSPERAR